jgi:hypothetical protein
MVFLIHHHEKRGVLQLTLQLIFLITSNTYNSSYLYTVNVIGQVVRVVTHRIYGATHYMTHPQTP